MTRVATKETTLPDLGRWQRKDYIEDPRQGPDDEHWAYVVSQQLENNKVRTYKIRFVDPADEERYVYALENLLMEASYR
eukprot:CAMPEP_0184512612 /NCGR_PEP_ID=MMETSP0198_2-20121128/2973_1 /TAXON_ID=1112570 /ORGANISM="Thraustochytrium sp., Strain LLF1b" /LENGTH=78 /DNA_ID=CAMNT_0026902647 /DNA_START=854 /DNA_END=1087 /DNA_ORIENTATION=-